MKQVMTHAEKMAAKKAYRKTAQSTHITRQLAQGKRIHLNFSFTPKGQKRTRNPIYDGVQL